MHIHVILAVLFMLTRRAISTCYMVDGNQSTTDHLPCSDGASICCALGRDDLPGSSSHAGATRDECLPNRLCQNRYLLSGQAVVSFWRGDCTDEGWDETRCLNICMSGVSLP